MQRFELYYYEIPTSFIICLYYDGRLNQRQFEVDQPSAMTVHHYFSTAWTLFAVARRFIKK